MLEDREGDDGIRDLGLDWEHRVEVGDDVHPGVVEAVPPVHRYILIRVTEKELSVGRLTGPEVIEASTKQGSEALEALVSPLVGQPVVGTTIAVAAADHGAELQTRVLHRRYRLTGLPSRNTSPQQGDFDQVVSWHSGLGYPGRGCPGGTGGRGPYNRQARKPS